MCYLVKIGSRVCWTRGLDSGHPVEALDCRKIGSRVCWTEGLDSGQDLFVVVVFLSSRVGGKSLT